MVDQNMANEETNQTGTNENPETAAAENLEQTAGAEGVDSAAATEVSEEEALRLKVETLEAELTEQKGEVLRARADFENSRRRLEKDKQTFKKYGLEGILKDILPCLDSFEQAVAQAATEEAAEKLKEGVVLVKKQ